VPTETAGEARVVRSHAFGLDVASDVELVGLPPTERAPKSGPITAIEVVAADRPDAGRDPSGEEVRVVHRPDGEMSLSVRFDAERGYLLTLPGVGAYRVSGDGLRVTCFPEPDVSAWWWQRALVNQVLPLAATVRGFEVLHAGAVAIDGRAVALVGHPGAGKSSTTLNLILQGATFFTDDALALERSEGHLLANPGAGVSNFPRTERELMQGEAERLGSIVGGKDAFKALLAVEREPTPLPLGALYFLRRGKPGTEARVERVAEPDPTMLLGSTYVLSVRSPDRLANQLDLCAAIAASVPIFDLLIPPTVPARDSAAAVLAHASTALAEAAA
jgi:hypothetical protein